VAEFRGCRVSLSLSSARRNGGVAGRSGSRADLKAGCVIATRIVERCWIEEVIGVGI
jgi:hypothetical protein